jgi:hypothetical protein
MSSGNVTGGVVREVLNLTDAEDDALSATKLIPNITTPLKFSRIDSAEPPLWQ